MVGFCVRVRVVTWDSTNLQSANHCEPLRFFSFLPLCKDPFRKAVRLQWGLVCLCCLWWYRQQSKRTCDFESGFCALSREFAPLSTAPTSALNLSDAYRAYRTRFQLDLSVLTSSLAKQENQDREAVVPHICPQCCRPSLRLISARV